MKKNKIYITIALLLLGVYAFAKMKKPKSRVIVSDPTNVNAYSIPGTTMYDYNLSTPLFTFREKKPLYNVKAASACAALKPAPIEG